MVADDCGDRCDVTIALLTRDAGQLFERVLRAIAGQDTDRCVELLAVDSGSTDGTLERLEAAGARVVSIPEEEFDFGRTRDLAFQHARGDVVINLSQDAVPLHSNWLENLIAPLADGEVGVSCGRSIPDPEREVPQFPWERNGYFYFTQEYRKFVRRYGRGVSFSNSAVPRAVWERFRIEPQVLGEDFQFQIKVHAAGLGMAFPADAHVLHHHHYDLRTLYRRCRDEGAAIRMMGSPYTEGDLVRDLLSPQKYVQWLREVRRGRLRSGAALTFPVVRPLAVYAGSRFR